MRQYASPFRLRGGVVVSISRIINTFEETVIILLLAGMTLLTFSQVIARYVFNSGWVDALELTKLMFAWMILFGMAYGVKIGAHLGVDAFIRLFPRPVFRMLALIGPIAGISYAVILLFGSEVYLSKMYKYDIRTEDLDIPRWIAYSILPIGLSMFLYRCLEAGYAIITGKKELMIAGHEAVELVAENKDVLKD